MPLNEKLQTWMFIVWLILFTFISANAFPQQFGRN
jgi:hypothetical protein